MADTVKLTPKQIVEYYVHAQQYEEEGFSGLATALRALKDRAAQRLGTAEPGDLDGAALQQLLAAAETLEATTRKAALSKDQEQTALYKEAAEQSVAAIYQAFDDLTQSYAQEELTKLEEKYASQEDVDRETLEEEAKLRGEQKFRRIFQNEQKAFEAEVQKKTAAQWLEEAKSHLGDKEYDQEDLVASIIAARQLANVRGGGAMEKKELDGAEFKAYVQVLKDDVDFGNFLQDYKRMYDPKDFKGKCAKLEDKLEKWVKDLPNYEYDNLESKLFRQYKFKTRKEYLDHQSTLPENKSGAEVIEGIQNKHRFGVELTAEDAATVLAARQLADATRKNRRNLDASRPDATKLGGHVEELKQNTLFTGFMYWLEKEDIARQKREAQKKGGDIADMKFSGKMDASLIMDGHGGKLEDKFAQFLSQELEKSRKAGKEQYEAFVHSLDPKLHGWYLKKAGIQLEQLKAEFPEIKVKAPYQSPLQVNTGSEEEGPTVEHIQTGKQDIGAPKKQPGSPKSTYRAWIKDRTQGARGDLNRKTLEESADRDAWYKFAAEIAAAEKLAREDPEGKFDEETLRKEAEGFQKDPCFRLVMRDEKMREQVLSGQLAELPAKVLAVRDEFRQMQQAGTSPEDDKYKMPKGLAEALQRATTVSEADMEECVREELAGLLKKPLKAHDAQLEKAAAKQAKQLVQDEYLKKYKSLDGFDEDLEVTVRIDDHTARIKKEMEQAEEQKIDEALDREALHRALEEVRKERGLSGEEMKNYREKPELAAEVEKRRASGRTKLDTYERRTALKLGMDLREQVQQAKSLAEENAPKRMRAKETKDYRQMIRSIKTIQEKSTGKYQMLESKHLMRAVNAILEYQDGKEAEVNNRQFTNSMHLLGELTAGTAAEKYYRQQLDKVNGIRGLKPGDPGFLKPEDFVSPDPEREKRAKENLPQEKAKEAAQPDAPAKGEPGAPIL